MASNDSKLICGHEGVSLATTQWRNNTGKIYKQYPSLRNISFQIYNSPANRHYYNLTNTEMFVITLQ